MSSQSSIAALSSSVSTSYQRTGSRLRSSRSRTSNARREPRGGDQPHDPVPLGLVPRAPRQQRAEDVLAELGPARHHVAQPGAVELDHVRRLDGHAGADRRLAGERGDVADERAAVGLGDVDVLAGLAVDELDQPALDHVERRVADGVLVEHLAGLERAPLAALGEPGELGVREAREEDLVAEVGEVLAANHSRRRHGWRLPARRDRCSGPQSSTGSRRQDGRAEPWWTVLTAGARVGLVGDRAEAVHGCVRTTGTRRSPAPCESGGRA